MKPKPERRMPATLRSIAMILALAAAAILRAASVHATDGPSPIALPHGSASPRPMPARPAQPAREPPATVHVDPFADPRAFEPSPEVIAAGWKEFALTDQASDLLPAPVAPAPDGSPLRTTAAEDLAAVGQLVPEQEIHPIDLPGAFRLAGARDLDIQIARARVAAAAADLVHARALWLPSIFIGPNWIRHDGQVQVVEGDVRTISKSSLFLGATAAAGSSVSGPVPAGGPAQVTGLTTVLRFSDAIFLPLAARQVIDARRASVVAATNDALLGVAESYMELQRAAGRLAIAREATANADRLAAITGSFSQAGAGLEGDHKRSLVERDRRLADVEDSLGMLEVASADLVRRTRLDPTVVVAPVEPAEVMLEIVSDRTPLDSLVEIGLRNRPELASSRSRVEETLLRLKQARLRPFIPSLALRYSGGGFGGGRNEFFGAFDGRSDADVNLYWETANLGFTDRAVRERREAERREADLEFYKMQDRVAAEVVQASKAKIAAYRQMKRIERAVPEAIASLELNFKTIREAAGLPVAATRPIEVLQPIQALADARGEYLDAVIDYNVAQFRLFHAVGRAPATTQASAAPVAEVP
jgi:outer membrane protein TolC